MQSYISESMSFFSKLFARKKTQPVQLVTERLIDKDDEKTKVKDLHRETTQFAEVITRLTRIEEQTAKEKTLSQGIDKLDKELSDVHVYLQREFDKLSLKEKEAALGVAERVLAPHKTEVLQEKIKQSLTGQQLTFTELEAKVKQTCGIPFSRGLFSKIVQELLNSQVLQKQDGAYVLVTDAKND